MRTPQPYAPGSDRMKDMIPFIKRYVIPTLKFRNELTGREDSLDPKCMWDIRTAYAMLPTLLKCN